MLLRLPSATILSVLMAMSCLSGAGAAELSSGGYSVSDELGGFRLLAVTGNGSRTDPLVVEEEIDEAAPVTLVIRRVEAPALHDGGTLSLVKIVTNRSRRVWAGFELELQEILKRPSIYTDGLSFSQFGVRRPDVSSDAFAANERQFEPHDRLRFLDGHVDPDRSVRFAMTITDPTPLMEFYLVQHPQFLSAGIGFEASRLALSFSAMLPAVAGPRENTDTTRSPSVRPRPSSERAGGRQRPVLRP